MNKYLRKSLYMGISALMIAGLGTHISNDAHASINPDRYGIDVFPSKKTHNRFAYQLRHRGHNSRVYYASKNSKLGRAVFDYGNPNIDYANYMARHHHHWLNSITKRLEGRVAERRRAEINKSSHKVFRHRHRVSNHNKRIKRYNRKIQRIRHSKVIKNKKRKASKRQSILRSRFKRSNNKKALKRSGFFDAHAVGGDFIFDKYAPDDKRAVVPNGMNVSNWYKGKFGQSKPTAYHYVSANHGWLKVN